MTTYKAKDLDLQKLGLNDNLVISRLFYLFRNLGGFSNLDLNNDEIEVSDKNRIKNLYRKIKNRNHIVKYNNKLSWDWLNERMWK